MKTTTRRVLLKVDIWFIVFKKERRQKILEAAGKEQPIRISDFTQKCEFVNDSRFRIKYYLEGLKKGFPTINYSQTLSEEYQQIIKLDERLVYQIKKLNEKRNRLHFFTDFKGAYSVHSHIEKWRFIKNLSIQTLEQKMKK